MELRHRYWTVYTNGNAIIDPCKEIVRKFSFCFLAPNWLKYRFFSTADAWNHVIWFSPACQLVMICSHPVKQQRLIWNTTQKRWCSGIQTVICYKDKSMTVPTWTSTVNSATVTTSTTERRNLLFIIIIYSIFYSQPENPWTKFAIEPHIIGE